MCDIAILPGEIFVKSVEELGLVTLRFLHEFVYFKLTEIRKSLE